MRETDTQVIGVGVRQFVFVGGAVMGVGVSARLAFVGDASADDARALEEEYQAAKAAQARLPRLLAPPLIAACALAGLLTGGGAAARYGSVGIAVVEPLIALGLLRAPSPAWASALAAAALSALVAGVLLDFAAPDAATAGAGLLALGAVPFIAAFKYPPLLPLAAAVFVLAAVACAEFVAAGLPAALPLSFVALCATGLGLVYMIELRSREAFLLQRDVRASLEAAAVSRVQDATRDHILGYLFHELRCVRARLVRFCCEIDACDTYFFL